MCPNPWCRRYLRAILEPQLTPVVPEDVRGLFEVARGVMVYGWLFYPLYTLGAEQCYRVVEAAVNLRYQQAGGMQSRVTGKKARPIDLSAKLQWLTGKGIILEEGKLRWDSLRKLRNMASHPRHQSLCLPTQAISTLCDCSEVINLLFREQCVE